MQAKFVAKKRKVFEFIHELMLMNLWKCNVGQGRDVHSDAHGSIKAKTFFV